MTREGLKDVALALSAANLCLLGAWRRLVFASADDRFLMRAHSSSDFLAALLNLQVLSILFWIVFTIGRHSTNPRVRGILRWLPVLALVFPMIRVGGITFDNSNRLMVLMGPVPVVLLAGVCGLLLIYGIFRLRRRLRFVSEIFLLATFPLILVTCSLAAWSLLREKSVASAEEGYTTKPMITKSNAPRVVWLVFDELDERLSFLERPRTVSLPELDRLRNEAFYAVNVSGAGDLTNRSMPSQITGRKVTNSEPRGANELMLNYENEKQPVPWSTQKTVFKEAREAGFNPAVVGWYLPYCRIFPDVFTSCFWQPFGDPVDDRKATVAGAMLSQLRGMLPFLIRTDHIEEYQSLVKQAAKVVADPTFNLVLVHFPVPHAPPIYNRKTEKFAISAVGTNWYLDNLALADHALGEMRRSMESAGVWDNTTVLLSSDHPWRRSVIFGPFRDRRSKEDKKAGRVPFLLKMAGYDESVRYEGPFNNVVSHDLILAVLNGKISDPGSLENWLQERVAADGGSKELRSQVREQQK
jgi:Sulfatase